MSRNSDGGLPVLATEKQVAELGMAVRKLRNVRGHNGIIVRNNSESIDIMPARALLDAVGGGGFGVSLYQLTGYWTESPNDPPGKSFKGRLAPIVPPPPNTPPGPEVRIYTWRYPSEDDLPNCTPKLAEWFNSSDPDHWVPCVDVTWKNPAYDPEAPPTDPPTPPTITAPRLLWIMFGGC